jgi:hypothetical protein
LAPITSCVPNLGQTWAKVVGSRCNLLPDLPNVLATSCLESESPISHRPGKTTQNSITRSAMAGLFFAQTDTYGMRMRFKLWLEATQPVTQQDLPGILNNVTRMFQGAEVTPGRSSYHVNTPNNRIIFGIGEPYAGWPSLFISFTRSDLNPSSVGQNLQAGTKQLMDDFNKVIAYLSQYKMAIAFNAIGRPVGTAGVHPKQMRRSSIYETILIRHGYVRVKVEPDTYIPSGMQKRPIRASVERGRDVEKQSACLPHPQHYQETEGRSN